MNQQTVELGKIVTILFNGPYSKPLKITIHDRRFMKKIDTVYISPQTPLAKAIINHKIGENIEFKSPEGKLKVKIINIFN